MAVISKRWPWLNHLFAGGAFDCTKLIDAVAYKNFVLQIIRRTDKQAGLKVLPRRWFVGLTSG